MHFAHEDGCFMWNSMKTRGRSDNLRLAEIDVLYYYITPPTYSRFGTVTTN